MTPSAKEAFASIPSAGLTKRELIAAMALQGLLADSTCAASPDITAKMAVQYADALLKELSK